MAGVVVPIDGDIAPLLAEFAKLPGHTQQEMDAVGRVIDHEITRGRIAKGFAELPGVSQKAAKKAANMLSREMDRAARETEKSFDDIRRGSEKVFGGIIGDIEDMGTALAQMGPLVGAATLAIGAAGGLVGALWKATEATGALKDEQALLDEQMAIITNRAGNIAPSAFERLYRGAIRVAEGFKVTITGAQALVNVAGALIDEFTTQSAITIGLLTSALSGNATAFEFWAKQYSDSPGYLARVNGAMAETAEQVAALDAALKKSQEDEPKIAPINDVISGRAAKGIRETTTAAKEAIPHLDAMSVILRGEGEDDTSFLDAQILDNMPPKIETLADAWRVAKEAVGEYFTALVQEGSTADIVTGKVVDAFSAIGNLVGGLATEGSAAAAAAVAIQKAAAIVSVTISTAQAVMQALAVLGPIAGPVAAGAITVTGVAQAALIAAQPEAFHTGGVKGFAPDESMARVRSGEGVLTGQGVQAMGGAAGVAAANRGEVGAREIRVVAQYQHRVFDAMIGDNIRMRSSPLHGALRDGKRAGVRRG